jgi:hypothetical protein
MAKSELVLSPGEEVKGVLTGEMFAVTPNVLANIVLKIAQFFFFLVGRRVTAQITVTNKRTVYEVRTLILWCCPSAAIFKMMLPNGVVSVEYGYMAMVLGCLCRKYVLTVSMSDGSSVGFVVKGGKKVAAEFCNMIADTLVK